MTAIDIQSSRDIPEAAGAERSSGVSRRAVQVILGVVGCILLVRFALPGLVLGGKWVVSEGAVAPLLDSEVRFLSALVGGLGILSFWMIPRVERVTGMFQIVMAATLVGGLVRIVSYFQVGMPPTRAAIATAIELLVPLVAIPLQRVASRSPGR